MQLETAGAAPQTFSNYDLTDKDISVIGRIIYEEAGIVVGPEKTHLIRSRLSKRLRELQLKAFSDYCALLDGHQGAKERLNLVSALTTNVTNFFREQHHFDHLKNTVLPELREKARKGEPVRIWSAGCSNGQEPYSIALTLVECGFRPDDNIKILATDIDPIMIAVGRQGLYESAVEDSIPKSLRLKHTKSVGTGPGRQVQMDETLKAFIRFNILNLHKGWPMAGPFDVIFCRNVMIYFDEPTREKLCKRFADILRPGGVLYIGHSERLRPSFDTLFLNVAPTTYLRKSRNDLAS